MTTLATAYPLPWRLPESEWRRSIAVQSGAIALVLVLGVIIPLVDLPQQIRAVRDAVTMTRITLAPAAPKPVPPPPPPPLQQTQQPDVLPEPVNTLRPQLTQLQPARIAPRTAVPPQPAPQRPPVDSTADAGVAALEDAFADMRAPDARTLRAAATASAATQGPTRADRALLGANQGRRAMALDAAPGAVGNVALAGRSTTRVIAPPAAQGARGGTTSNASGGPPAGRQRSLEEIRRVFDANKGTLFGLYQAALLDAPGLSGKIVLELVISPDGHVERVWVVSSEIAQPSLVEQVTNRVRSFRFDPKDVGVTTVTYPVHFLPS